MHNTLTSTTRIMNIAILLCDSLALRLEIKSKILLWPFFPVVAARDGISYAAQMKPSIRTAYVRKQSINILTAKVFCHFSIWLERKKNWKIMSQFGRTAGDARRCKITNAKNSIFCVDVSINLLAVSAAILLLCSAPSPHAHAQSSMKLIWCLENVLSLNLQGSNIFFFFLHLTHSNGRENGSRKREI